MHGKKYLIRYFEMNNTTKRKMKENISLENI